MDGSLNFLPSSEEIIFLRPPSQGRIGLGVVFVPLQPGTQPIYVRAFDTRPLNNGADPASAEMGALFLGLALLNAAGQHECHVHSDDELLVRRMERHFDYSVKEKNLFLAAATHNLVRLTESTITHVKGHPERRRPKTHSSKWSDQDWGIHVADRLSKGQPLIGSYRGTQYPPTTDLNFWDVLSAIPIQHPFPFLSHGGLPLLSSPSAHIARRGLHNYCDQREDYSSCLGRRRQWQGHSTQFAAKAWGLSGLPIRARSTALRIIWDKNWHGWNRVKDPSLTQATVRFLGMCPHCGHLKEDQNHWIRSCPSPTLRTIRTSAIRSAYVIARKSKRGTSGHACRAVSWASTHQDGHWIWTGHWPASLQREYCLPIHLPHTECHRLHRTLLEISRILTQATLAIWKARHTLPITFEARSGLAGPYQKYAKSYHHLSQGVDAPLHSTLLTKPTITPGGSESDSSQNSPGVQSVLSTPTVHANSRPLRHQRERFSPTSTPLPRGGIG